MQRSSPATELKGRIPAVHGRLGIQFLKFALVGITGTAIDFGLFYLLLYIGGFHYLLAGAISFCLAMLNNFTLNRTWTFADVARRNPLTQLAQFFGVSIIGVGLNLSLMAILVEGVEPRLSLLVRLGMLGAGAWRLLEPNLKWWPLFAKAIATIIVLFWNFAGNRLWTFRAR